MRDAGDFGARQAQLHTAVAPVVMVGAVDCDGVRRWQGPGAHVPLAQRAGPDRLSLTGYVLLDGDVVGPDQLMSVRTRHMW